MRIKRLILFVLFLLSSIAASASILYRWETLTYPPDVLTYPPDVFGNSPRSAPILASIEIEGESAYYEITQRCGVFINPFLPVTDSGLIRLSFDNASIVPLLPYPPFDPVQRTIIDLIASNGLLDGMIELHT